MKNLNILLYILLCDKIGLFLVFLYIDLWFFVFVGILMEILDKSWFGIDLFAILGLLNEADLDGIMAFGVERKDIKYFGID
jgi:hypothetical protein